MTKIDFSKFVQQSCEEFPPERDVEMRAVKLGDKLPGRGLVTVVDVGPNHTTLYFDDGHTLTLANCARVLVVRTKGK